MKKILHLKQLQFPRNFHSCTKYKYCQHINKNQFAIWNNLSCISTFMNLPRVIYIYRYIELYKYNLIYIHRTRVIHITLLMLQFLALLTKFCSLERGFELLLGYLKQVGDYGTSKLSMFLTSHSDQIFFLSGFSFT